MNFKDQLMVMRDEDVGNEFTNGMFFLSCRYFQKGMAMF